MFYRAIIIAAGISMGSIPAAQAGPGNDIPAPAAISNIIAAHDIPAATRDILSAPTGQITSIADIAFDIPAADISAREGAGQGISNIIAAHADRDISISGLRIASAARIPGLDITIPSGIAGRINDRIISQISAIAD